MLRSVFAHELSFDGSSGDATPVVPATEPLLAFELTLIAPVGSWWLWRRLSRLTKKKILSFFENWWRDALREWRTVIQLFAAFPNTQKLSASLRVVRRTLRRSLKRQRLRISDIQERLGGLALLLQRRSEAIPSMHPTIKRWAMTRRVSENPLSNDEILPTRIELIDEATEIHREFGVWPISFSYPEIPRLGADKTYSGTVSPIVPGAQYSFRSEKDYLQSYGRFKMAPTHKKGGWDCLRHLEILASGSIPLMPDAKSIPPGTMHFYPKHFLRDTARDYFSKGLVPQFASRFAVIEFARENLSSSAMATYLLQACGLGKPRSILFVDESLPTLPDYLSVLTLIGLKQLLGRRVQVTFPVDYMYTDSTNDYSHLYGRGFGYTKKLHPMLRTESETKGEMLSFDSSRLHQQDLVIVGSGSRNQGKLDLLSKHVNPTRLAVLHGEDSHPGIDELGLLIEVSKHVFVRELSMDAIR